MSVDDGLQMHFSTTYKSLVVLLGIISRRGTYRVGENVPQWFSQNNHKIKSRYIYYIVTMDYADKSDVDVFTVNLTLVMY